MSTKWSFLLPVAVVLGLTCLTQSFQPLYGSENESISHKEITTRAILQKTAEVCRDIAALDGGDFSLTIDENLTIEQVHDTCSAILGTTSSLIVFLSSLLFHSSIRDIYAENARVDAFFAFSDAHHFDDESFQRGKDLITQGVATVKANVRLGRFETARVTLGRILHTLQDFYSHSNWVELGNTAPYNVLIFPDQPLENLAGRNIPTCRDCDGDNCDNNILPNVLENRLLTSGYFSVFSGEKPDGKCSHGGGLDRTSRRMPVGGINKDMLTSEHGSLHNDAASLAVTATMELLEDIRIAGGERNFLRLMGLFQTPVLCFVIDTTGSMADEIEDVKILSAEIINSRRGFLLEPEAYILVPFNDPDFGPAQISDGDGDMFIEMINSLTADGGGDIPELSLSALQLALTTAPPLSEIFVFTDAPAKDAALKNTIIALIERTKCVVTFLLTNLLPGRRKRELDGATSRVLAPAALQLYRDLATAAGGETVEVNDSDFALATTIIEDSLRTAKVIIFQQGSTTNQIFQFTIDNSLRNIILSITGNSLLTYNLTSPTGVTQNSSESSGPLASLILAGTLRRLSFNNDVETGLWEISVNSEEPYLVRITGQSPVNFIFTLGEPREDLDADFLPREGRPISGRNMTILITLTGENSNASEVTLFDSAGPTEVNGTLEFLERTDYLATFNEIPAGNFMLRLRGFRNLPDSTPSMFERQAATQISTSTFSLTTQINSTNLEPGSTVVIPFTLSIMSESATNDTGNETFTIRAINDRGFETLSPISITVLEGSGGIANDTVSLSIPESAELGSDVTMTIEVEDQVSADLTFAVLRFAIGNRVTDITPPVCTLGRLVEDCPMNSSRCDLFQWTYVAEVTDSVNGTGVNGTGVSRVIIRQGNGTLNTTSTVGLDGENVTMVSYQASCCADTVELAVVDNAGNVGSCIARANDVTPPMCLVGSTSTCPPPSSCNSSEWEFVINVTDASGVNITITTVIEGNLNTSTVVGPDGETVIMVSYRGSCCVDRVEFSAVDMAGNEVTCVGQARESPPDNSTTPTPTTTPSIVNPNTIAAGGPAVSTSLWVWVPVVIQLFGR
ncbi:von Willebrand factor A domain-containing protein 7-like isoform X2 [Stigmatopora argus]